MSFLTDTLRELVGRIEVRSTLGPNIKLDDPFAPGDPAPSTTGGILKPAVTIFDKRGDVIATSAPYGDPGVTKWPLVVFGLGSLLGWLTWRAFGRK